jgi:hypothetical protein
LLLAAGQGAGHLPAPFTQAREELVYPIQVGAEVFPFAYERTHLQIFAHGHLQKRQSPFGHLRQPAPNDGVRRDVVYAFVQKRDGARLWPQ